MKRVIRCAAVALILGTTLCTAASKVEIRVVPRPRPDPPASEASGPFPFRAPADPTGPFASSVDTLGCLVNIAADFGGQSVLLDLCHLKNVTFIETPPAISEATPPTESSPSSDADSAPVVATPPPSRKILGMFRGWKIDPIYKNYKYAVFDDGDACGDWGVERYSVTVELVKAAESDATPRVYDVRQLTPCSHALRVEAFVPEWELYAPSGIHTPGVVDVSDAEEMLPRICGEMKCQYSHVAGRVDVVKQEIQAMQRTLDELVTGDSTSVSSLSLSAASRIIKSSTDVMEKALEVLQSIEQLEKAAHEARQAAIAAAQSSMVKQTEVVASS